MYRVRALVRVMALNWRNAGPGILDPDPLDHRRAMPLEIFSERTEEFLAKPVGGGCNRLTTASTCRCSGIQWQ